MERSAVGSLLRSTQAFCSQLCEKSTLGYGIAYSCAAFAALMEANQFREVIADTPGDCAAAWEEAERHFAELRQTCRRWAPAGGVAPAALHDLLTARGYTARSYAVMLQTRRSEPRPSPTVRILPARAIRQAARAALRTLPLPLDAPAPDTFADAYMERLDDPQYELFVAMENSVQVGRCALYQVGDIGWVRDLSTAALPTSDAIQHALLTHILALSRRLLLKIVCTQVCEDDVKTNTLFATSGFEPAGFICEYDRVDRPS